MAKTGRKHPYLVGLSENRWKMAKQWKMGINLLGQSAELYKINAIVQVLSTHKATIDFACDFGPRKQIPMRFCTLWSCESEICETEIVYDYAITDTMRLFIFVNSQNWEGTTKIICPMKLQIARSMGASCFPAPFLSHQPVYMGSLPGNNKWTRKRATYQNIIKAKLMKRWQNFGYCLKLLWRSCLKYPFRMTHQSCNSELPQGATSHYDPTCQCFNKAY